MYIYIQNKLPSYMHSEPQNLSEHYPEVGMWELMGPDF